MVGASSSEGFLVPCAFGIDKLATIALVHRAPTVSYAVVSVRVYALPKIPANVLRRLTMVSSSSDDSLSSLARASTERDGDGGRPMAEPGPAAAADDAALDDVYEAAADIGTLKDTGIRHVI